MMLKKRDRQSLRKLRQDLKHRKHVEVEIMSLTDSDIVYECPKTNYRFVLDSIGQKETLELDLLFVMANKYRGFFTKHLITITDFDDDDYTIEDLLDYLGLTDIYDGIENTDGDYIKDILELDNYDFEKLINTKGTVELYMRLAERMVYLFDKGKFNDYTKSDIIARLLGMSDLFDIVREDLEAQEREKEQIN